MPKKRKQAARLRIDELGFALAGGIISAICAALVILPGLYGYYPFTNMIFADLYARFGYWLNMPNALLGIIYCFAAGFILAYIFALIYNKLAR